jgi:hypothetical protein
MSLPGPCSFHSVCPGHSTDSTGFDENLQMKKVPETLNITERRDTIQKSRFLRMTATEYSEFITISLVLICLPACTAISAASASDDLYNVYCDWESDSGGSCCVIMKTTDPRSPALSSPEFSGGVAYTRALERLTELTAAGQGRDCEYGVITQADNTLWNIYCDWESDSGGSCCVVKKTTDPRPAALSSPIFVGGVTYNRAMEGLTELTGAGLGRDCEYGTSMQADNTRWSIFCNKGTGAGRPGVGCCVVAKTAEPPSASHRLMEFPGGVPLIQAMDRLDALTAAGTVDYCGSGVPVQPIRTGQTAPTRSVTPAATVPPGSGDDPFSLIQGFIEGIIGFIERLLGGGMLPWGPSPTPYPSGDLYEIQPKVGPMKNR